MITIWKTPIVATVEQVLKDLKLQLYGAGLLREIKNTGSDLMCTCPFHARTPQEARSVLLNSLKTEVVMTANLREWRHFLSLRACGSTGKPHPQMLEVAVPLLKELRERVPVVFDDLEPMEWETVK